MKRMNLLHSQFLAVTPAKNELKNLIELSRNLNEIILPRNFKWVVVVNNSDPNFVSELSSELDSDICSIIIYPGREKGLSSGVAFKSWKYGVELNLNNSHDFDYVMKLDADVRLSYDYFSLIEEFYSGSDLVGGITSTIGSREQTVHIQGCVKLYSIDGYTTVSQLPTELGFDVVDELYLKSKGLSVQVIRNAKYELTRQTHTSEGSRQGMLRNGKMCRWVGYFKPYFALHLVRALIRKPFLLASLYVFVGYISAGPSPYSSQIRNLCKESQKSKLKDLLRNPFKWFSNTYYG